MKTGSKHGSKVKGLKSSARRPDNLGIYARGTVDKIEAALKVNMVQVTRQAVSYAAAQDVPTLPSAMGAPVNAIVGLGFQKSTN